MAVKMQYRNKKSWTVDTLYIELDLPDPEILAHSKTNSECF